MWAEWRTMQFGTARKPASRNFLAVQPSNFEGTLSHHFDLPGPPPITSISFNRKDNSTAFFSHWWVTHSPVSFDATRKRPASNSFKANSTAFLVLPLVFKFTLSRFSHASSIMVMAFFMGSLLLEILRDCWSCDAHNLHRVFYRL